MAEALRVFGEKRSTRHSGPYSRKNLPRTGAWLQVEGVTLMYATLQVPLGGNLQGRRRVLNISHI